MGPDFKDAEVRKKLCTPEPVLCHGSHASVIKSETQQRLCVAVTAAGVSPWNWIHKVTGLREVFGLGCSAGSRGLCRRLAPR